VSKAQAASSVDHSPRILKQLSHQQQSKLLATPTFSTNSAVAILGPSPADSSDSGVRGSVVFTQSRSADHPIRVRASITGLKPNCKHGFHIHTLGDLSKGCMSAGGHWNPFDATHGARSLADLCCLFWHIHGHVVQKSSCYLMCWGFLVNARIR
jgi:Cu/Zn superoxide dismutase